jgi:hypothetical protein
VRLIGWHFGTGQYQSIDLDIGNHRAVLPGTITCIVVGVACGLATFVSDAMIPHLMGRSEATPRE